MQALQSLTRHQLVMSNSFVLDHHDSVSEPGDSNSVLHHHHHHASRTSPLTPSSRRRSIPYSLRRSQSLQEGLNHQPIHHTHHSHPNLAHSTSRFDLCRTETRRLTSWSEFTVRKTLVRFRTRKSVTRHPMRRLSGQRRVPAETIKEALDHEYEVAKSEETGTGERLSAVFFCWFYGWIMDLYYNITEQGTERSFVKWVLACLLVTFGALTVIALTCFALHQVNFFILLLLNNGVLYLGLLGGFLVVILGALAIVNFD